MPVDLEEKLKATAKERRYGKERTERYVYGTLRRMGWLPKKKHKRKAI